MPPAPVVAGHRFRCRGKMKGKGLKAKGKGLKDENSSKEEIIRNLKRGFKELQLIKQGKLKTTPAKDFLNKL